MKSDHKQLTRGALFCIGLFTDIHFLFFVCFVFLKMTINTFMSLLTSGERLQASCYFLQEYSPLIVAIHRVHFEISKLLIEKGANVNLATTVSIISIIQ